MSKNLCEWGLEGQSVTEPCPCTPPLFYKNIPLPCAFMAQNKRSILAQMWGSPGSPGSCWEHLGTAAAPAEILPRAERSPDGAWHLLAAALPKGEPLVSKTISSFPLFTSLSLQSANEDSVEANKNRKNILHLMVFHLFLPILEK